MLRIRLKSSCLGKSGFRAYPEERRLATLCGLGHKRDLSERKREKIQHPLREALLKGGNTMEGYTRMDEITYIKKFCNGKYSEYLKRTKGFRSKYEQTAYHDRTYIYDDENKIEVCSEYYLGD